MKRHLIWVDKQRGGHVGNLAGPGIDPRPGAALWLAVCPLLGSVPCTCHLSSSHTPQILRIHLYISTHHLGCCHSHSTNIRGLLLGVSFLGPLILCNHCILTVSPTFLVKTIWIWRNYLELGWGQRVRFPLHVQQMPNCQHVYCLNLHAVTVLILSVCVVQYLHPAHLTTSPLDISLNVTRELWQSSALTLHCLTTCPPRFTPSRGDSDFMIDRAADFWNCQDFCFSNKRSHCKKFRTDETRNDRLENQSSIVNSVFSNTGIVWKHLNSPILFILWIVVSSLQTQFVVEGYNYFPKGGRINTHHQLHPGKCQIKSKIFAVQHSWWWW